MTRRNRAIPVGLVVLAYALALIQRPGTVVADTKINLYADPVRFLGDVAAAWTPSGSLGHVFSGQYGGYLFPMAPFFALGHLAGVGTWVVQRAWLGSLLALAAYGAVRVVDSLYDSERGPAHLVAGAMYLLNPYVVTYADRTSVSLLGYAALPWLLLCVHQGLREPRGWGRPALFALVLTASGGGVNAAVTAWLLLGPALLFAYELGWGGVGRAAAVPFLIRLVPLTALTSLWWVVGVLINGAYGFDFLGFTEQPGSIWNTTSIAESLRLMGFWPSYFGYGYDGPRMPFNSDSGVMLFQPLVVAASLIVPGLALSSFAFVRRRRYAPFFLALVLAGLLVMTAGFPNGTPLRRGLDFTYYHLPAVRFLRTSYKAGPLVALGLAALGGMGAAQAWRSRRLRAPLIAGCAALLCLAAWPLVRGRALDARLALPHGVPAAWVAAARDLDRSLPANTRAMVLPGQPFAFYTWGGTIDSILPALSSRPVAVRYVVPYADPRASELQWAVDGLVSQQRALPAQLPPLLDLLGVGAVISATDDNRRLSGGPAQADAARALARGGLTTPARSFGPVRAAAPSADSISGPLSLPEIRRYATATGGVVRVLPRTPMTVVDGSAGGMLELAAFGELDPGRAYAYAADLQPRAIRSVAASGGEIVISDSNQRRIFVSSRLRGNAGPALAPGDPVSPDAAVVVPFPGAGTDAQTVEQLGGGISYVRAPSSPGFSQFPEHRPFAALDGDLATAWLADRFLDAGRHYLDVGFPRARDVPYVDLFPYQDSRARVLRMTVGGHSFHIHPGWNHLVVNLHGVSSLRLQIDATTRPRRVSGGAGGISELRIPGTAPHETLRPPVLAERALAGAALDRATLEYLFQRTTGDRPLQRQPLAGEPQAGLVRDQGDAELGIARSVLLPAGRRWSADAIVSVAPRAPDDAIDRLAGYDGPLRFDSSSRYEGNPGHRASQAFGGDGWIGEWLGSAWISWSSPAPLSLNRLRLVAPALAVRRPTRVQLEYDGHLLAPVAVGAGGSVALPGPVRARRFVLHILAARFPAGTSGFLRQRRAVGILRIDGAVADPRIPAAGPLRASCGAVTATLAGRRMPLVPAGTVAELNAGTALRAHPCGPPLAVAAGPAEVGAPAGVMLVDDLRLRSAAPLPAAAAPSGGGAVLDPGVYGRGSHTGVRVAVRGPSWLVLGEGYNRGWRASCDGRSLGAPVPLQGYANAWPLDRSCRSLAFTFAPNGLLRAAEWISAITAAVLLGVLLLWRRRAAAAPPPGELLPVRDRWEPLPLRRAVLAGAVAAAVLGFVFALRAGIVLGPLLTLALWRGFDVRRLILWAGGLLVIAVPAIYVLWPARDHGGYNSNYAVEMLWAHWVALLAVAMLGLALFSTARDARGSRARAPRSGS